MTSCASASTDLHRMNTACQHCGGQIPPTIIKGTVAQGVPKRFCSRTCAQKAANCRRSKKYQQMVAARPPRACAHCGTSFPPHRNQMKYCSFACKRAAGEQRRAERRHAATPAFKPCATCGIHPVPNGPDRHCPSCQPLVAAERSRRHYHQRSGAAKQRTRRQQARHALELHIIQQLAPPP